MIPPSHLVPAFPDDGLDRECRLVTLSACLLVSLRAVRPVRLPLDHASTVSTGRRSDRGISGPRPNRTTRSGRWLFTPRKLANCGRRAATSAEAFFIAGSAYDVIGDPILWPSHERYFEACVRRAPHSRIAVRFTSDSNSQFTSATRVAAAPSSPRTCRSACQN